MFAGTREFERGEGFVREGSYGGYGVVALAEGLESVSAPNALSGAALRR